MTGPEGIRLAEQLYAARDWAAALAQFESLVAALPAGVVIEPSIIFAINHCRIELAAPSELAGLALLSAPGVETQLLTQRLLMLIPRVRELCQQREFARASALLRSAAAQFELIASIYRNDIDRTAAPLETPWTEPAPFLTHGGFERLDPERSKQRFAGMRVLLVLRRQYNNNIIRSHEPIDNMQISALRFGLEYRDIDPLSFRGDLRAMVAEIERTIEEWRPALVIVENLTALNIGLACDAAFQQDMLEVMRGARRRHGSRVVGMYGDAWLVPTDLLAAGFDDCMDIAHHMHPAILSHEAVSDPDRIYCYPFPFIPVRPSLPPDSIPRFSFVGSIELYNVARLVWWAELGRVDAPVDFFRTDHVSGPQRSDQEYATIMSAHLGTINFVKRNSGVAIHTGRSIEALLAGGLLIDEANQDTPYFLRPNVDYVAFSTLDELTAVLDALARDPERRASLRAHGRAWAERYFTGDYFWAGLLEKTFPA